MRIDCINNINVFDSIKPNWNDVYSNDPHSHIFLSWAWLRGWFLTMPYDWRILAVRKSTDPDYVAFFPVSKNSLRKQRFFLMNELRMGGTPQADYTGFICLPEYEEISVAMFANYIQRILKWDIFYLNDVFGHRYDSFLSYFPASNFNIHNLSKISCPYISLPNTWEEYLTNSLGRRTRQGLTKKMRCMEKLEKFRATYINANNLEQHIEILLKFWQVRWGKKSDIILERYRVIFKNCFYHDCLWMCVLWDGAIPMAAHAAFIDTGKKCFYNYITAYNPEFNVLSPGRVMFGHSIKYAIENRFKAFDFLKGNESYKFSLGAKERGIVSMLITRKNINNFLLNMYSKIKRYIRYQL